MPHEIERTFSRTSSRKTLAASSKHLAPADTAITLTGRRCSATPCATPEDRFEGAPRESRRHRLKGKANIAGTSIISERAPRRHRQEWLGSLCQSGY